MFDAQYEMERYSADEMALLKKIVIPIRKKYSGLSNADDQDLLSISNYALYKCAMSYSEDVGTTFEQYLRSCIENKIKTYITDRNRQKRIPQSMCISMDDATFQDVVVPKEGSGNEFFDTWYSSLTKIQKEIADLMLIGLSESEIQIQLNISKERFRALKIDMGKRGYTKPKPVKKAEGKSMGVTAETNKRDRKTVSAIIDDIESGSMLFDHPAQRAANQWSLKMKSNLISDVLQGNPIPPIVLAEQTLKDDVQVIWNLDGKQRCTTLFDFTNNKFKISSCVRRRYIKYQTVEKDPVKGIILKDEYGYPRLTSHVCDIRLKHFDDLPAELQKTIRNYTIDYTEYLNCSDEDITYHVERYNSGRQMNSKQKGVAHLGMEFASKVKAIEEADFFRNHGNFSIKAYENGTVEGLIISAVMLCNFPDNWSSRIGNMCDFLKLNADIEMFERVEEIIDELDEPWNDELDYLATVPDLPVIIALYDRYWRSGHSDIEDYISYLQTIKGETGTKSYDGIANGMTFRDICALPRGKHRKMAREKLELLTIMMEEAI